MKRVLLCQAVVPLALVACAPAQTVSTQGQTATPIVPEFLQTFDSAHELDTRRGQRRHGRTPPGRTLLPTSR